MKILTFFTGKSSKVLLILVATIVLSSLWITQTKANVVNKPGKGSPVVVKHKTANGP